MEKHYSEYVCNEKKKKKKLDISGTYGYVDCTGSRYEIRRDMKLYAGISEAHSHSDGTGIRLRISPQALKYRHDTYARDSEACAHGVGPVSAQTLRYKHEIYTLEIEKPTLTGCDR